MALSPNSGWRRGALARVNEAYTSVLVAGFPTAPFDGEPELETLQCRSELDRSNWLGLLAKCNEAQRLADLTETPEIMDQIGTVIRCTSNRMYPITFADAKARMLVLLGQAEAAQARWWSLKDQVRDAETRQDLQAINLGEGWP